MYPFTYGSYTYGFSPDTNSVGGAAYNAMLYDENLYDAGVLVLGLFDSVTGTDFEEPYPQVVKTELLVLADAIYKLLNNDPWLDDVVPMESVVAFLFSKPMNGEAVTMSEILAFFSDKQLSPETISVLDTMVNNFNTAYADFMLITDVLTKQITNKGLSDSYQLNDWMKIKLLFVEQWHD